MATFGERIAAEFDAGRRLCAGIDPHEFLLAEWGLADSAAGAEQFGLQVVAASKGVAAAVKPQVAFFERYGAAGYAALEVVLRAARESGLLVIADAKRGDVGSSFDAYADAWLKPGSPLEADAMTASAFQGFEVLDRALTHAKEHGKGVFVLAATSNPEAQPIQTARVSTGESVSQYLLEQISDFNAAHSSAAGYGNVGAVLGATVALKDYGVDVDRSSRPSDVGIPILAPGFGHQGGTVAQARQSFGRYFNGILVSESRSVLAGGPTELAGRIRARADELAREFSRGRE